MFQLSCLGISHKREILGVGGVQECYRGKLEIVLKKFWYE